MYDQQHPAPDYRHRDAGSLYYVGTNGYSWASAVNGSSGMYLSFHITGLYTSRTDSRGYGLQLRCLSE
ncbi:hypothetical protein [uncultured Rikenella sp.]|nr:hypothetical protein [uncultured Rikenella sp.]